MTFSRLPLRRVVTDACDGPFGSSLKSEHYSDAGARVVRLGNIGNGQWNDEDRAFLPTEYWATLSRHHAVAGDLLMAGLGDENHPLGRACVMPDLGPALVKADCYRLRLDRARAEPRFISLFLSSAAGGAEAMRLAEGSTRLRLTLGKALSIPIPNIPVRQQRTIADYLDTETARVDRTLRALRQSITLMDERRRALITEVFAEPVREGRGTTVRAIALPLLGRQRSPEQAVGPNMVRYLRAANVKDGRLELNDVMEMNFTPNEQVTFALRPGDVLVTEGAGSLNAVGANAVWAGELQGTICFQNTLVRIRPKPESDPRYVAWWGRYAYESGLFRAAAGGANIYHLGVETIRALPAWAPSLAMQRDVADRLDREVGMLERQASVRTRQVASLIERRQALITAAVTGQLDIPGVAA